MTDKLIKKADLYANNTHFTEYDNPSLSESLDISKEIKQAYIAGAKENNFVWHKQSDTDDIYDACNDWHLHCFVCKMKDGSYNIAFGNCDEDSNGIVSINIWFEHEDSKYYADDIVAWCELPKLEIKE